MIESGYYPPGAEFDPRAPYNQYEEEQKYIPLDVCISQTLHKSASVEVNDYEVETWEEYEDGTHTGGTYCNTSGCNLKSAVDDQVFTPLEIMKMLPSIHKDIEEALQEMPKSQALAQALTKLKLMAEASQGWEEDELEVIKE